MYRLIAAIICLALAAASARAADDAVADAQAAATKRFDESPAGKALLERRVAAESRLARARQTGAVEERTEAAQALLEARQAYRVALQKDLEAGRKAKVAPGPTTTPVKPDAALANASAPMN